MLFASGLSEHVNTQNVLVAARATSGIPYGNCGTMDHKTLIYYNLSKF